MTKQELLTAIQARFTIIKVLQQKVLEPIGTTNVIQYVVLIQSPSGGVERKNFKIYVTDEGQQTESAYVETEPMLDIPQVLITYLNNNFLKYESLRYDPVTNTAVFRGTVYNAQTSTFESQNYMAAIIDSTLTVQPHIDKTIVNI